MEEEIKLNGVIPDIHAPPMVYDTWLEAGSITEIEDGVAETPKGNKVYRYEYPRVDP